MKEKKLRQLAAVMFTDIVGYTALMQGDEEAAIKVRARHREVFQQQHQIHQGEIIQYYGDGTLSVFKSAIEAAKCAIEIQRHLQEGDPVSVRIGLHMGDIVFNKTEVYGDGVNYASRIESMSVAGAILLSGKLNDELKNHTAILTTSLGFFDLKNIAGSVEVFAITNKGIVVPQPAELKGKQKIINKTIAVLPFVNMSASEENEYFSDGITEELLNALTKLDGLQVTSRTSAFAFKGKNTDIREIGKQLNVDRILEGSVRKAGNRVRISAQLINATDGYHIWSEIYDRDLTDIFEVQDEISSIIANKCRKNLTAKEHKETLVKAPTQNLEAYTLFLKGLHFHNKVTPRDTKKAIECFEKAITLQSDYASAYAMAAAGYAFLGATGQMQPKEAFEIVHTYSDKALQLDSSLAMAYVAKGSAYLLYDWKWEQAYDSLQKAIELHPATTAAHQLLSLYYMSTGRKKEAVDIMEKALQVDPISPIVHQYIADAYLNAGRTDDALKQVERLLDLYPNMRVALELKGWCTGVKGDWKKAAEIFEEIHRLIKHPLKGLAPLGFAYAKSGKSEKALECIRKIEQLQVEEPEAVLDIDLAMVWWSLGEKDKAFHHLFQCVEKKMGVVAILLDHPMFIGASDDPMYQLLKKKLNLVGDEVNFASRIESVVVAGSIPLSEKFNDELKNHRAISTVSLAPSEMKNIALPVEAFAITNKGIVVSNPSELKGEQKIINKTIAVLPFVNMSASEENEYFSDGITEEIINALSKIKSLKVTSRTSSFFFKNKNVPIKQIASDLNVSAILEGSVRLSGDKIRITAQLIHAEEDFHFWSETWDRKLENIFEIQDEISLLIAEKLREQFGHFEIQEHLVKKQTDNISAYEFSLKGKFHFNKWNPGDMRSAISLYEKAIELDPKHTESYLGLAECYGFMATMGFLPYQEAWEKSTQLTTKASQLNDHLPAVHYQLAHLSFFATGNYKEAYKQTSKAISLSPNYIEAQQFMSFLQIIAGEKEKALQHIEVALSIDPLSPETLFHSAFIHYMLEDYEKALEQLERCLKHNPKNIPVHTVKCHCLLKLGRCDEVINYFDTLPPEIVVPGDKLGITALAYAIKKDFGNTEKYITELIKQANGADGFLNADSYLFLIYGVTGNKDKAFEWISRAIESNSFLLCLRFADSLVNPIKVDPRYNEYQKIIFSIDQPNKLIKEKKALLNKKEAIANSTRLLNYLRKEEPYLDPDLSLRSLANKIDIQPNQLSWLLNESLGKNFNEFINHYRVETFKVFSKDPKNAHKTLMGLAYESGFNSKTVFNTSFKKETGITPKQFLEKQD